MMKVEETENEWNLLLFMLCLQLKNEEEEDEDDALRNAVENVLRQTIY